MIRKYLTLLLVGCLLFGFAACGGSGGGDGASSGDLRSDFVSGSVVTDGTEILSDFFSDTDASDLPASTDDVSTDSDAPDTGLTDEDATLTDSEDEPVTDSEDDFDGDEDDSEYIPDGPVYETGDGNTDISDSGPSFAPPPVISTTTDTSSGTTDTDETPAEPEKTVYEVLTSAHHYVGLCDQINGRVIVCDLAVEDWSNDRAVVWEYKHNTSGRQNYGWIAGIKFRHSEYYGEDVLIFCGPPSKAYIVSMKTKKILLTANNTGSNPHSVELLPNGTFIVGSSTDGKVSIYPPGKTKASKTYTLAGNDNGTLDVHGVLWDPKYETLWVSGGQKLRAFSVTGTTAAPTLTQQAVYTTPAAGLHDLAPVYGNTNQLILTCSSGAIAFNKNTKTFSYSYPGAQLGRTFSYIPGCGNFTSGVFACTAIKADTKVYQDWDTNIVQVYVPLGNGKYECLTRKAPNDAYYKLRVYNFDYQ